MNIDDDKTASTQEEFEKLVKEGKPFHLKAQHAITLAKLPDSAAPIMQITGDTAEIISMLFYALAHTVGDLRELGMDKEEIKKFYYDGVELAVDMADAKVNATIKTNDHNIVSIRIEKALKARNMTRRQLARKTGITEATISRYASGQRIPRGPEVVKIATALKTTCDYILGLKDKL